MQADLTQSRASALYAALAEVERLAALLPMAPELSDRMAVTELLAVRHARYKALLDGFYGAGDLQQRMSSAAPAVDDARSRSTTGDWWEELATIALCAPLTDELFAALLTADGGAVGDAAKGDGAADIATSTREADAYTWPVKQLRAAAEADDKLAARLALWSRRLVGEAIVLARVFGGDRYPELANLLAANHARRLAELALDD